MRGHEVLTKIRIQIVFNNLIKPESETEFWFCSEAKNDSIQRPESSVQSEASRFQLPALAARVQEFRYAIFRIPWPVEFYPRFSNWFFKKLDLINCEKPILGQFLVISTLIIIPKLVYQEQLLKGKLFSLLLCVPLFSELFNVCYIKRPVKRDSCQKEWILGLMIQYAKSSYLHCAIKY